MLAGGQGPSAASGRDYSGGGRLFKVNRPLETLKFEANPRTNLSDSFPSV